MCHRSTKQACFVVVMIGYVLAAGCEEKVTLHEAAIRNDVEAVRQFIADGADVNALDGDGHSPFHAAMLRFEDDPEIVELLIGAGAEINYEDSFGETPLTYAVRYADEAMVALLIDKGANVDLKNEAVGSGPLTLAVVQEKSGIVKLLLERGANVNYESHARRTPLHASMFGCDIDTIKLLLAYGANVNAATDGGYTPLILACSNGCNAIVLGVLIAAGADVNATDDAGHTPLFYAEQKEQKEAAKLLRAHGAQLRPSVDTQ